MSSVPGVQRRRTRPPRHSAEGVGTCGGTGPHGGTRRERLLRLLRPSAATTRVKRGLKEHRTSIARSPTLEVPVERSGSRTHRPSVGERVHLSNRSMASANSTRVASCGSSAGADGSLAASSSPAGAGSSSRSAHANPPATNPAIATRAANRGQAPGSCNDAPDDVPRAVAPLLPASPASSSLVTRDSMGMGLAAHRLSLPLWRPVRYAAEGSASGSNGRSDVRSAAS